MTDQPKIGVFENISNEEYHAGPEISKSGLDKINRSPLHFAHAQTVQREPTAAMKIGTAAHDLILEPEEFWSRYAIPLNPADFPDAIKSKDELVAMVEKLNENRLPKLSASGSKEDLIQRILDNDESVNRHQANGLKAGELKAKIAVLNEDRQGLYSTRGTQKELAAILAENGQPVELWSDLVAMNEETNDGKTIISQDDFELVQGMRDAVMNHPIAGKLLAPDAGQAELSCFWRDERTGVQCRVRPDFWRNDDIVVDLKTCLDASPDGFAKSVNTFRYHVQEALYRDGIEEAIKQGNVARKKPKAFVFVAVEKAAPHAVAVYALDSESVAIGRREYRENLNTFARCKSADKWPGYSDKIQPLSLPAWRLVQEEYAQEGEAA